MGDIEDAIKQHEDGCEIRKQMPGISEQMDDIHALFFGDYDKPKNGLVMAIDRNTSFRKWAIGTLLGAGMIGILLKVFI